jgi:hypothetical protein
VALACEGAGGMEQVVRDRGAQCPGGVGAEVPGGQVRQGPVDQVGEHGFDDRVTAVDDVGLRGRQVCVGEERVVAPHREQRVEVAGVPESRQAIAFR